MLPGGDVHRRRLGVLQVAVAVHLPEPPDQERLAEGGDGVGPLPDEVVLKAVDDLVGVGLGPRDHRDAAVVEVPLLPGGGEGGGPGPVVVVDRQFPTEFGFERRHTALLGRVARPRLDGGAEQHALAGDDRAGRGDVSAGGAHDGGEGADHQERGDDRDGAGPSQGRAEQVGSRWHHSGPPGETDGDGRPAWAITTLRGIFALIRQVPARRSRSCRDVTSSRR